MDLWDYPRQTLARVGIVALSAAGAANGEESVMGLGMGRKRLVKTFGALGGATVAMVLVYTAEPAIAGTPNTAGPTTTTRAVQPTYSAGNITSCPSGTTTFI